MPAQIGLPFVEGNRIDEAVDLLEVTKLTEDDLTVINGRRDRLEDKIQQRYGFALEHVRKEVDDWMRWQPENRSRRPSPGFFLDKSDLSKRTPG